MVSDRTLREFGRRKIICQGNTILGFLFCFYALQSLLAFCLVCFLVKE